MLINHCPPSIKNSRLIKIFLAYLIVVASFQVSSGQSVANFNKISVTSPTASALQKFTDYPVNLNTGLIDVSIPIYQINVNGINVPIEFKYHASGIKYDDESEGLGLGWTLMAGGMVTGVVQGNVDNLGGLNNFFKDGPTINPTTTTLGGDNSSLMMFDRGYGDSEYDIYNFTFPGHSGKFFYPGVSTPVISPLQNLKINGTRGGTNIAGGRFDITDENGILYKFGYYSNGGGAQEQSFFDLRTCNFMLTEVISADKTDTVRFNYNIDRNQLKLVINDQVVIKDQFVYYGNYGDYSTVHQIMPQSYLQTYTLAQLTSITFRTGRVEFSYDNTTRLTGINVYNKTTTSPLKAVTVQQSNYGNDYYKLDQVNFFDSALQQSYNYKLAYNGTPYNRWYTGIDYWGYHNGNSYINDYVPNFQIYTSNGLTTVGSMDRTPDEYAMQQGMLQKVTYPTGGSSVFNFEAHRYEGGQMAGGLRIKKIDNYDLNGGYLNSKWYKYGLGENGDGVIYRAINTFDYYYNLLEIYVEGPYSFPCGLCTIPDHTANERHIGAFPMLNNSWGGSAVVYDYITEYTGDGTNANGKTVYNYQNVMDEFTPECFYGNIPLISRSNSWKTGQLLSKQVFSRSGTSYNQVYTLTNQYQDFNNQDYHCLKIMSNVNWHSNPQMNQTDMWNSLEDFASERPLANTTDLDNQKLSSVHSYADYYLTTGSRELTSSTEVRDGVSNTTGYTYDPTYLKPATITTAKSDGNNVLTNFTYPFNLTAAPYPSMVANNIIGPVITKSEFKNDTGHPLESVTTNYGNWGNLYAPQSVSIQKGSGTAETRLIYDLYDNRGNVLQRHKNNGPFEAYLWGYNGQYPVAEVKNATYQQLLNVLGQNVIDQLSGSNPGSDIQVRNLLAPLRTDSRLKNTSVTIYTYSPLVGMTSMTDSKGMTTTYEYDSFQRLMNIKDKDGNIIKHNDYHYQNQ